MLFNSLEYAIFLPIVFLLYWFVFDYALKRSRYQLQLQNAFIVVVSYIFYGWWDWRFLLLIAFTSFCSWGSGLLIGASNNEQLTSNNKQGARAAKAWMWLNIIINLGILGVFKYYDFFLTEFYQLFHLGDAVVSRLYINIILPVGISFYTFQALSYSIDVYRKKIEPTRDIIAFFAFISFFPQLVAGPIERATNLLPQFLQERSFNYDNAADGMRQILWGLFKKIVIADNCAVYVDQVWSAYDTQSGGTLLLAAVLFTFQIYGDFSGYSDIAIGTAKLFGIKLMRNFNNPYFSRDIAEFWRRWHISLTTWFRDYVYIPLGGSRVSKTKIIRNTFVIFLLSGFWHGANWTFIAWGAYHALLFLPLILLGKNRKYTNQISSYTDTSGNEHLRLLPTWKESLQMLCTFALVVLGWIIFRAETITQAWQYITCITNTTPAFYVTANLYPTLVLCIVMLCVEWLQRNKQHALEIGHINKVLRICIAIVIVETIIFFMPETPSQFIYFQF